MVIEIEDFELLANFIKKNYGINLKGKKHLVEGRLSHYIHDKNFKGFKEYVKFVLNESNGHEMKNLLNKLTTNHTYFFREIEHFDYLKNNVLPYLEKNIQDRDLRIWSAACSTGEEAYTLAMLIDEYFGAKKIYWDTKILATDISNKAIKEAKQGIYSKEALKNIPSSYLDKYFELIDNNNYKIISKIREQVIFSNFNLMEEVFPFKKKFHVIFCRNVMIYFEPQDKVKLVNKFFDLSEKNGYFFTGLSEAIDKNATKYSYIRPSIYRKL